MEEILSSANTMPFCANNRVVIINDCDNLTEKQVEQLEGYLKNPARQTVLIMDFCREAGHIKSWGGLTKLAKRISFERLEGTKIDQWIESHAAGLNKKIRPDAVGLIKDLVGGGDLYALKNELEKLALFVLDREEITKQDVEEIVGKSLNEDVFRLIDVISAKKVVKALDILRELLARKVRPHEIVGTLAWHFRRAYLSGGVNSVKKQKLEDKIELLLSTDLAIKRSKINPQIALEIVVIKLCND